MTRESRHTLLTAAVLSFFIAWGTVECLITAFGLNLAAAAGPVLVCGISALVCATLFSLRYGGLLLLCLTALLLPWLHRDGRLILQLQQLLHELTTIYDRAYGLGVIPLPADAPPSGSVDLPLALVGILIVLAICRCICRRRSLWLPVLSVLLPLCSCIVVTDTVPEEGWLFLVMAGLLLLILPQNVRRENMAQGFRLTVAAALPVVLALGGLFLSIPQEGYVNQSAVLRENILTAVQNLPQLMENGMTRIASGLQKTPARQVDLAGLGPRISFTYPVMEVTAEQSGLLYLREQDYDRYDGLTWQASEGRTESFSGAAGQEETIHIRTEHRKDIRYLTYHPGQPATLVDGREDNPKQETTYTLLRRHLPENWRQTAYRNTAASPEEWAQYLSLPETARTGAAELLANLCAEAVSNTEKADRIAAFVTDSARYDLDPGKMPSSEPDFALWFLREADSGYCVHFATAATVLLRAAGVPARYVTGYLADARAGQAVTVTEEDAHAWAEYYEPNLGLWLPLEVTPAEVPEEEPLRPQPMPTAPAPTEEPEPVVTEATLPPETMPSSAPTVLPSAPPETAPRQSNAAGWLLLPALILILALQRSVRIALRRKLQRTGDANRQALYRWREALRLSRLLKESPTEELIALAQKAKFSQHELTPEELQLFDSFNRSCLRRLRERSWLHRLVYRYLHAAW